ncbi:MAG TPA: DoxX family protein [Micromonosporaceae bacterium]|nr:DoxX family protein [Micromonosporaceae bacterium]
MIFATVIASVVLALVSAGSGIPKVIGTEQMVNEAKHLGVPRAGYVIIGSLELAAAVGLLAGLAKAPIGIAAAAGMVLMMIGAVAGHARAGDRLAAMAPALTVGVASAITLGLRLATA